MRQAIGETVRACSPTAGFVTWRAKELLYHAGPRLGIQWRTMAYSAVVTGLFALLVANNLVLIVRLPRGAFDLRCVATLDACLAMATLVMLKWTAHPGVDNVLYPCTVTVMPVVGFTYRRPSTSVAVAAVAATVYAADALRHPGFAHAVTLLENAMPYLAWQVASWFLAVWILRLFAGIEEEQQVALARERERTRERERAYFGRELDRVRMDVALHELNQQRERARLSQALHDHVLQTLEFVARDTWIADPRMRDYVASEAAWLRDLVRGEPACQPSGLAAALDKVVTRQTAAGMRIEVNTSGLYAETLSAETVQVLADVVTELLTNVRKHAGTARAVLRVTSAAGKITVTVMDLGCGFDPCRVAGGLGLQGSVVGRIREAGGQVVVTSAPGAGAHVEVSVPLPERPGMLPVGQDPRQEEVGLAPGSAKAKRWMQPVPHPPLEEAGKGPDSERPRRGDPDRHRR